MKCGGVTSERGYVVLAVGGNRGGRITPHKGGDGSEARIGEGGKEVSPSISGIGKPVEAKGKRP
jgi:hypothetical protein